MGANGRRDMASAIRLLPISARALIPPASERVRTRRAGRGVWASALGIGAGGDAKDEDIVAGVYPGECARGVWGFARR